MPDKQFSVEELNQHLNLLLTADAGTGMSVIYNVLVAWVHRTYKDGSKSQAAYDKFINHTNLVIHYKSLIPYRGRVPSHQPEKGVSSEQLAKGLSARLNQLQPENALEFLAELTGAWCLACPREKAREYYNDENMSDVDLAERLFLWVLRPFDFFH